MCILIWYVGFMGTLKKKTQPYCLDGCSSMIVWTHAALGVLHASFVVVVVVVVSVSIVVVSVSVVVAVGLFFVVVFCCFFYLHLFSAVEHVSHGKKL